MSQLGLQRIEDSVVLEQLSDEVRCGVYPKMRRFPESLEKLYLSHILQDATFGLRGILGLLIAIISLSTGVDYLFAASQEVTLWDIKVPSLIILMMLCLLENHRLKEAGISERSRSLAQSSLAQSLLTKLMVILTVCLFGFGSAAYSAAPLNAFYGCVTAILLGGALSVMSLSVTMTILVWLAAITAGNLVLTHRGGLDELTLLAWNMMYACAGFGTVLMVLIQDRCKRRLFLMVHMDHSLIPRAREWMSNQERIRFLVAIDKTTGIADRNSFDRALKFEWHRARKANESIALLLIDVSGFLSSSDQLSELSQDLKRFAKAPGDILARYSDTQLSLLLTNTELAAARLMAQKIFKQVKGCYQQSLQIGLASGVPKPGFFSSDLQANADEACLSADHDQHIKTAMF